MSFLSLKKIILHIILFSPVIRFVDKLLPILAYWPEKLKKNKRKKENQTQKQNKILKTRHLIKTFCRIVVERHWAWDTGISFSCLYYITLYKYRRISS